MTEVNLSARISEDTEKEIEAFMRKEKIDRSTAVRKLLDSGIREWREERALRMLGKGEITFSKAAKIARMDVWTFAEKLKASGTTWVRIMPEELKKELSNP